MSSGFCNVRLHRVNLICLVSRVKWILENQIDPEKFKSPTKLREMFANGFANGSKNLGARPERNVINDGYKIARAANT